MYVEVLTFRDGEFLRRFAPFYTKKAYDVYDSAVAKYSESGEEAMVCQRQDNHVLLRVWDNIKPKPKYGARLKEAKKSTVTYERMGDPED